MAASGRFSLCEVCGKRQGSQANFVAGRGRDCFICHGLLSNSADLGQKVIRRLRGYQFKTFSIGVIIPGGMQEREDQLRSDFQIRGRETAKSQMSKEIATFVKRLTRKRIDRRYPDLTILVDLERGAIIPMARSVFVYGRYTKPPNLSQRRELCDICRGRGCGECQSGYKKAPSVEQVLENRLGRVLHSKKAKFTWLGSEDPNSVVFAPGRPFVAEFKNPVKRQVPSRFSLRTGRGLVRAVGVKVLKGRPTSIPSFTFKTRVFIMPEQPLREIPTGLMNALKAEPIQFRNNKGKLVQKRVYDARIEKRGARLVAEIKLDGGLPVKRLVSGGSVSLSLAGLLGTPLDCQRFDILRVWESGSFKFGKI